MRYSSRTPLRTLGISCTAAEVFSQLPPESREVIVSSATDQELGEIVEELFVDDAVDTLEELPANVANRMLRQAQPERCV